MSNLLWGNGDFRFHIHLAACTNLAVPARCDFASVSRRKLLQSVSWVCIKKAVSAPLIYAIIIYPTIYLNAIFKGVSSAYHRGCILLKYDKPRSVNKNKKGSANPNVCLLYRLTAESRLGIVWMQPGDMFGRHDLKLARVGTSRDLQGGFVSKPPSWSRPSLFMQISDIVPKMRCLSKAFANARNGQTKYKNAKQGLFVLGIILSPTRLFCESLWIGRWGKCLVLTLSTVFMRALSSHYS